MDNARSELLASELLVGFMGDRPILPPRTNVFVADIAADVERLGQFIQRSWRFADFPCLIDDSGPVPIDLSTAPPALSFMSISAATPLHFYSQAFENLTFEGIPVEKIRDVLRRRIAAFLSVRGFNDEDETPGAKYASVGAAYAGFSNGPAGFLAFQVQTHLSGLRIHYSPSYLIDWSNVFGAPSTPVDGWIRPGRYKFGAMRPDGAFLIDNGNFDIPPLAAATLSF